MKVVVQRVKKSSVTFDGNTNKIGHGLTLLVGFTHNDTLEDIDYIGSFEKFEKLKEKSVNFLEENILN